MRITLSQVVKNKKRYTYSEAVAMGFCASQNGLEMQDNPMPIGTILGTGWVRGWQEAKQFKSGADQYPQGDW